MITSVPISFGSGTAFHVSDDTTKQDILRDISDRMKVKTMKREARVFRPGTGQDTRGSYVVHMQTGGNPYVLFLTTIGYTEVSLYVDRKVRAGYIMPRIICDRVAFPRIAYAGTVLTGEMVRTSLGEWVFLAEDLLAYRGQPMSRSPLRERYALLISVVGSAVFDEASTHRIVVKRAFPADDEGILRAREFAASRPYSVTGVIYRSLVSGSPSWFVRGRPRAASAASRVMMISRTVTPDVYDVSDGDGVRQGRLDVPDIWTSRRLAAVFDGRLSSDSVSLPCVWGTGRNKWRAVAGGLGPGPG